MSAIAELAEERVVVLHRGVQGLVVVGQGALVGGVHDGLRALVRDLG